MSLKRNTLWNIGGAATPLIVAVFAIPYLLKNLGTEGFGVLTLIWGLIGYFSLFDLGVGRALTYELSRRSPASSAELAPYLRAGLALTLITGLLGAGFVAILADLMTRSWLNIGADWQTDAMYSFLIAAVGIIPTTISAGMRGALEGLNRFSASNLNRLAVGVMMFALPAWSVYFHGSKLWVATLYMVGGRAAIAICLLYQLRELALSSGRLKTDHLWPLLNYGTWVTVSGVVGPLMVYGDRFFVSAAVGANLLPNYAIPQEALQRLLLIPTALCGALLPQLAVLSRKKVRAAYGYYFKRVSIWMFYVCGLAAIFAYPALRIWISPAFANNSIEISLILTIGVWINAMAMVPYTVLQAMGKPKTTAIFHVFELVIYVALLWVLTNHFGLVGAALAWTTRVALDLVLLKYATRKMFK
jgi:O-antigen/teichoic acid export membrane protein